MKYHIVGGSFDAFKGRPSSVVEEMSKHLDCTVLNGGNIDVLRQYDFMAPSVLIWMPKIDNYHGKMLPSIKETNPRLILISSKRAIETDYKESDVVGRLLKSKSNLGIMITEDDAGFMFKLLDPLGNQWVSTRSIEELCYAIDKRVKTLASMTRVGSVKIGEARKTDINPDFIDIIKEFGNEFTKFVNAINPNRFLGNAATRCSYGFPSIKESNSIYVTRRNVDKATLTQDDFVEIESHDGKIGYYGDNKPSVDSPIQLRLFEYYDNVKYMLHGHVYVGGAPCTTHALPCGSVEEIEDIKHIAPLRYTTDFVVNLWGHGFLALASNLDYLCGLKSRLRARPFPELGMRI